jgi:hypothetical protein
MNEILGVDTKLRTAATPASLQFAAPPYKVECAYRLGDGERDRLHELLDLDINPYREYGRFLDRIRTIARDEVPSFFRELCRDLTARDIHVQPVHYLQNCPIDHTIPVLDFDDPLTSKYQQKHTFVSEAFLAVISELLGTTVVGYRTANRGDMFQDVHPVRALADTQSQKTAGTLNFHADIPNNKVRPDWVYLLSLRNSRANRVYTMFVRLADVLMNLDESLKEALRKPLYYAPREVIHVYGGQVNDFTALKPMLLTERGYTFLAYFEGNTRSDSREGQEALAGLSAVLHRLGTPLFLDERDFVAFSNNTSMHARKVEELADPEANRNRWLLKTWNVDRIEDHVAHLMPGRIHTSDE